MKNELSTLHQVVDTYFLDTLNEQLTKRNLLDEHRNLSLAGGSEQDFLQLFLTEKLLPSGKPLSEHTKKAYQTDAKTLLTFMQANGLTFRAIGYPEVKAYNQYIVENYAPKSAVRKLEFFRRLLNFGYETKFYEAHLSTWIQKPKVVKGHIQMQQTDEPVHRQQVRELSQADAELIIRCMADMVKTKHNREALQKRNTLMGYLLYTTGLRATELLNLNWGSFRLSRQGQLFVDVIGKGDKPRSIPVRKETEEVLLAYRQAINEPIVWDIYDTTPLFYTLYNRKDIHATKKRLTYAGLYEIMTKAVALAEQTNPVTAHWFRHTFVTSLLENDVPLAVVKDWAGHADISTTNIYLERVNQENSHAHMQKVSIFSSNQK